MPDADILVVEDELPLAEMMRVHLQRAGYRVRCAQDGDEALTMVAAQAPDLVVLDIMLPTVNGWQVLEKLKADPETQAIPVVVLTALTADRDVAKGWGLGTDCYLTKPFKVQDLLLLVDRFVAEAGKAW